MSSNIAEFRRDYHVLRANRFAGPASEGPDRVRIQLVLQRHNELSFRHIVMDRTQWAEFRDQVDRGFAELPVHHETQGETPD